MAKRMIRVPKHSDIVTVEGRMGIFAVIGIDPINKTVEVRATSAPFIVFKSPWAAISYAD
jgi:hypothetical protein